MPRARVQAKTAATFANCAGPTRNLRLIIVAGLRRRARGCPLDARHTNRRLLSWQQPSSRAPARSSRSTLSMARTSRAGGILVRGTTTCISCGSKAPTPRRAERLRQCQVDTPREADAAASRQRLAARGCGGAPPRSNATDRRPAGLRPATSRGASAARGAAADRATRGGRRRPPPQSCRRRRRAPSSNGSTRMSERKWRKSVARRKAAKSRELVTAGVARPPRLRERKAGHRNGRSAGSATFGTASRFRAIPRRRRRPWDSGPRAPSTSPPRPASATSRARAPPLFGCYFGGRLRGFSGNWRCECAHVCRASAVTRSSDGGRPAATASRRRPSSTGFHASRPTKSGAALFRLARVSVLRRVAATSHVRRVARPAPSRGVCGGSGHAPPRRRGLREERDGATAAPRRLDSRELRITTDRLPHALAHVGARQGASEIQDERIAADELRRRSRRATPRRSRGAGG